MWSLLFLLGTLRRINTLIARNMPPGVFRALFWHLSHFAMHTLFYSRCCSACSQSHASTCHLLAFSSSAAEHVKKSRCCQIADVREFICSLEGSRSPTDLHFFPSLVPTPQKFAHNERQSLLKAPASSSLPNVQHKWAFTWQRVSDVPPESFLQ